MLAHSKLMLLVMSLMLVFGLVVTSCAGAATPTVAPAPAAATKAPAAAASPATGAPAAATAAPAGAATSAGAASPAATGPAKVTIAIGGDPTTLDAQQADDGNMRTITDNINETLLTRDQNMKLIPLLADSYKQVDATTWELKMHPGIKFTNGEACDAAAAAFSINRIVDEKYNSEIRSNFETIASAKAVDAATVQITTKGADPILPARMNMLPILPPKAVTDDAKGYANKPIGTGPYTFVEWVRGTRIVLKSNPNYWGTKPQVTDVVVLPRQEPSIRLSALKAGEVDLIRDLLPEQVNQAPKYELVQPGIQYGFVRINTAKPALKDPRIRQAMNYAIDNASIVKGLYGGMAGPVSAQLIGPTHFGFNPDVKPFPFDLAKAQQLIKEAGYDGSEITLVAENGRWLKDKELNEAVAQMLTKAGFKVKLVVEEWTRWLDLLFAQQNQPDLITVFNDNQIFDADRTYSAYYLSTGRGSTYHNAQVDQLLNSARNEMDSAKRLKMYQDAIKISGTDDPAHIYLVNLDDIWGLSKRLDWKPRIDSKVLFGSMKVTQ